MRIRSLFLIAGAVLALLALAPAGGASPNAASVTVRRSAYGTILFDGRGRALYAFTRDAGKRSRCYGACAAAWPSYVVRGGVRADAGAKSALIGTTRRADGTRQVTYGGRPVYFYVGDRKAGQVLCQNVREYGGLWLVLRPSGKLVR